MVECLFEMVLDIVYFSLVQVVAVCQLWKGRGVRIQKRCEYELIMVVGLGQGRPAYEGQDR